MRTVCLGAFAAILTISASCISAFSADLPEIRQRGKLIAATSGDLVPVTYLNDKNQLEGYDIEVAHFIETRIGVPIDLVRLDFKGILAGLQSNRFDAVFSNVNITDDRRKIFDYSIPYSRSAVVAVIRKGINDIRGYKDLKGKVVGGISGGNDGEIPAREIAAKFGAFKDFKGYTGNAELFADLAIGRLDAVISPDTAAGYFLKTHPGVGEIVGEPYKITYVGVPMQKGSTELKAAIDRAITEMRQQNLLDKWGQQYFGIEHYSAQLIDHLP
jgi:L-cystine transport system substrate-binding protein